MVAGGEEMHILDSHFHWWPRSFFEDLCKRSGYPRAQDNGRGGYVYFREKRTDDRPWFDIWVEWFDLDAQLAHMDQLGHRVDVVSSIGPFSVH
jgi:aminocarboxymuconate-semialdehyde decarboxylase